LDCPAYCRILADPGRGWLSKCIADVTSISLFTALSRSNSSVIAGAWHTHSRGGLCRFPIAAFLIYDSRHDEVFRILANETREPCGLALISTGVAGAQSARACQILRAIILSEPVLILRICPKNRGYVAVRSLLTYHNGGFQLTLPWQPLGSTVAPARCRAMGEKSLMGPRMRRK
jgi:hypothetical protein